MKSLHIIEDDFLTFSNDQFKQKMWNDHIEKGNFTLSLKYIDLLKLEKLSMSFFTGWLDEELVFICLIGIITLKIGLFEIRIAMIGAPKTNGKAFWYNKDLISYASFVQEMHAILKKHSKSQFLLLREFSGELDRVQLLENQELGFINHHALVKSYLNIELFESFEDYFNNLPSKKRNYFKSILKHTKAPNVQISVNDLTPESVEEIYKLYIATNKNAKENRTAALSKSLFLGLCESGIQIKVAAYRLNNKLIAFGLMFLNDWEVKCLFTGFDYEFAKAHHLWYQIMLESIRFAINQKCFHVDMGSSSAAMKDKFLALHEDLYISVLFRNKFLTKLFNRPIKYLLNKILKPVK